MKTRAALRASAFAALFVALLVAVRAASTGTLAAPDFSSVQAFTEWVEVTGAIGVAMSLLRLGTEILLWYLVVVSVLHAVAAITQATVAVRIADLVAAPLPGRFVRLVVGVSLMTAASPVALSGDQPADRAMERAGLVPDDFAVGRPLPASGVAVGGPAWGAADPFETASAGPVRDEAPKRPSRPPQPVEEPRTWTVGEGESFWVIADDTVSELLGRPATNAEIVPYWRTLIDLNRDRLVDPANPDLILPGQVLELPVR